MKLNTLNGICIIFIILVLNTVHLLAKKEKNKTKGKKTTERQWPPCAKSCSGLADGDYQSCQGCNVYASCAGGVFYDNRPCPVGLFWDDTVKKCQWASTTCNSQGGTDQADEEEEGEQRSDTGPCPAEFTGLYPHPENCARFYNCSDGQIVLPSGGLAEIGTDMDSEDDDSGYLECPYPQLFSIDIKQCAPYMLVRCGNRFVPKSPCDYHRPLVLPGKDSVPSLNDWVMSGEVPHHRQRRTPSHGMPCWMEYPVCVGLPDGPNPWIGKANTPMYALCKDERTMESRICDIDEFNTKMQFWGRERRCESIWYIPRREGGRRPECKGKKDGLYHGSSMPLNMYYQCRHGIFNRVHLCPKGELFRPSIGACGNNKQKSN